jgi:hypothetical protein
VLTRLIRRTVRADDLRPGHLVRNSWGEFVGVAAAHEGDGWIWVTTVDHGIARLDPDDDMEVVVEGVSADG